MERLKQAVVTLTVFSAAASSVYVLLQQNGNNETTVILGYPNLTNRGEWGELRTCSNTSEFTVVGLQLRVEYFDVLSEDNAALTGVWLACGISFKFNENETESFEWITSANTSSYGHFQQRRFCSGNNTNRARYAVGMQLKFQPDQGPSKDNLGATNLKIICGDGEEIEGYYEKENPFPNSAYLAPLVCPRGMSVCGMQTKVEAIKMTGDNVALSDLRIKCCPIPQALREESSALHFYFPKSE